jgi:hypothetical protein
MVEGEHLGAELGVGGGADEPRSLMNRMGW